MCIWASANCDGDVQLDFIRPGKLLGNVLNVLIESFNGQLRDRCLNLHQFASLAEAQGIIEAWRVDYNARSPHSSLGLLTPNEFVSQRLGRTDCRGCPPPLLTSGLERWPRSRSARNGGLRLGRKSLACAAGGTNVPSYKILINYSPIALRVLML